VSLRQALALHQRDLVAEASAGDDRKPSPAPLPSWKGSWIAELTPKESEQGARLARSS
jgi:hypothetical protein